MYPIVVRNLYFLLHVVQNLYFPLQVVQNSFKFPCRLCKIYTCIPLHVVQNLCITGILHIVRNTYIPLHVVRNIYIPLHVVRNLYIQYIQLLFLLFCTRWSVHVHLTELG